MLGDRLGSQQNPEASPPPEPDGQPDFSGAVGLTGWPVAVGQLPFPTDNFAHPIAALPQSWLTPPVAGLGVRLVVAAAAVKNLGYDCGGQPSRPASVVANGQHRLKAGHGRFVVLGPTVEPSGRDRSWLTLTMPEFADGDHPKRFAAVQPVGWLGHSGDRERPLTVVATVLLAVGAVVGWLPRVGKQPVGVELWPLAVAISEFARFVGETWAAPCYKGSEKQS